MNSVKLLTAVGVSVCAIGFAVAQPGMGQGKPGGFGPGGGDGPRGERMRLFERLDANGDGAISQEEADAAKAQHQERQAERAQAMAGRALERFDANEDGVLDEAELTTMFAKGPRQQAQRGEGKRGGPEGHGKRAGREGRDGRGGRNGKMGRAERALGPEALKEFDTDGDGKVSRDEARDAREAIKAKLDEKRAEMINEFDLDGDGELSQTERETMRNELRSTRRVGNADLDNDGALSAAELEAALIKIKDEDPRADFNADGVVNQADYETLVNLLPGA